MLIESIVKNFTSGIGPPLTFSSTLAAIEPTIYSRYGSYFLILLLVGSVIIVGRRRLRA
jgi:hypothetical protein